MVQTEVFVSLQLREESRFKLETPVIEVQPEKRTSIEVCFILIN